MIRSLRLGNFKAFAETQQVPVRPLTLIYGPNSAGKSSIIHSLALAHHAMHTGDLDAHRTEIGGESIDLGGFRQYVHGRIAGRQMQWSVELATSHLSGRLAELLASTRSVEVALTIGMGGLDERQRTLFGGFARTHNPLVGVETCSISVDGSPLVTMSARVGGALRIDQLDQQHPVLRNVLKNMLLASTTTEKLGDQDFTRIDEAVDELVPNLTVRLPRFLPRMDRNVVAIEDSIHQLLVPLGKDDRGASLKRTVGLILPRTLRDLIDGTAKAVEESLSKLRYLGPLRSYPPRHLAFSGSHDNNWHAGGGASWDVLRRDAVVREAVNGWLSSAQRLSTPYEVVVRQLVPMDQLDEPLGKALEALQENDGLKIDEDDPDDPRPVIADATEQVENFKSAIANGDIDRFTELVLMDRRRNTVVSHRDVGIGVSQVLPVLVHAFGLREQLVAIEQPEIHLHPALQAELGDVFIESALGERRNTFLLETHSEHLILRLLRRIREASEGASTDGRPAVRPEDVSLLYVDPQGTSSQVIPIDITRDGEFARRWPNGFFAERAKELL